LGTFFSPKYFSKVLCDLDVLDFHIELLSRCFGNFCFGDCFGYFKEKLGDSFMVTLTTTSTKSFF
jgi:hypothetical protein